jgi:AraC-like DNA-binding protein
MSGARRRHWGYKAMAADPLSDLLRTVRLTGAVFFEVAAQEPWAVGSPARERILPSILPGADHLIAYHVVTTGRCFATADGGEAIPLEAGQVVVFTSGQPHTMSSGPNMRADPLMPDVLDVAASGSRPFCINFGNGAPSVRLVCGYLACNARPYNPLLENLPAVITAGDPRDNSESLIAQFVRFAVAEATDRHAGSESVLTKLSELMFIDVVRRYLEKLPPEQAGWLAGLRDPLVGKALSLMHAKPAHDWTIEELAKQAGLSRSVLAERFVQFVGIPPMQYLGKWRMQIATELLTGSNNNVASIAAKIGYESEAAFSRAFKKMIGVAPTAWRRRG